MADHLLTTRSVTSHLQVVEWIEFKPRRGMRSTKLNRSSWSTKDLKARNEAGKGKKCGRPKGSGRTRSVCAALRTKRRRATGSGANRVVGRVDTPLPKKMHAATRPSRKEAFGMHRRPDKNFWCPPPNPSTSRQSQKASNVDEALQTRESRRMLRYAGQAESELRRAREDLKVVEWIEFKPSSGHEVDRAQSEQLVDE